MNPCNWCGATAAKRTGQPFDAKGLEQHQNRCPKRPSATGGMRPVENEVIATGGKSIDSTVAPVADGPSLSSSEEEKNNTAAESAVVGDEKTGESESIQALWARHKYDRTEKGKPVFSRFEHSLMARDWRYLTAKQRDTLMGVHAALRAHAFDVQQQEAAAELQRKWERGGVTDQEARAKAEAERLEREADRAHNAEFWQRVNEESRRADEEWRNSHPEADVVDDEFLRPPKPEPPTWPPKRPAPKKPEPTPRKRVIFPRRETYWDGFGE